MPTPAARAARVANWCRCVLRDWSQIEGSFGAPVPVYDQCIAPVMRHAQAVVDGAEAETEITAAVAILDRWEPAWQREAAADLAPAYRQPAGRVSGLANADPETLRGLLTSVSPGGSH